MELRTGLLAFREVNVEEPGNRHYIVMIAFGMRSIEAVFRGVTKIEFWVRRSTGAVFIAAGIYYAVVYIFEAF